MDINPIQSSSFPGERLTIAGKQKDLQRAYKITSLRKTRWKCLEKQPAKNELFNYWSSQHIRVVSFDHLQGLIQWYDPIWVLSILICSPSDIAEAGASLCDTEEWAHQQPRCYEGYCWQVLAEPCWITGFGMLRLHHQWHDVFLLAMYLCVLLTKSLVAGSETPAYHAKCCWFVREKAEKCPKWFPAAVMTAAKEHSMTRSCFGI